jgi:ABC-type Fe3+-hydroxamate transport system substrate-binding protein
MAPDAVIMGNRGAVALRAHPEWSKVPAVAAGRVSVAVAHSWGARPPGQPLPG